MPRFSRGDRLPTGLNRHSAKTLDKVAMSASTKLRSINCETRCSQYCRTAPASALERDRPVCSTFSCRMNSTRQCAILPQAIFDCACMPAIVGHVACTTRANAAFKRYKTSGSGAVR